MEEFGTLDSCEQTIAILGDRWRSQAATQEEDSISAKILPGTGMKYMETAR